MKKGIIKTTIISLVICAIIILLQKIFAQDIVGAMKILCNSFFSVGILVLCIGAIDFCSQEGAFDIFGFSISLAFGTFKRNIEDSKYKTYADYKAAKHPDNKPLTISPCLIVGPCFTAISFIFLAIYNHLS